MMIRLSETKERAGMPTVGTRKRIMKTHSVLLLYPEYMANDFGKDCYLWNGTAADTLAAVQNARRQCDEESKTSDGKSIFDSPEDLHVLLAGKGKLENTTWQELMV
jgi:hypothetical protein